MSTGTAVNTGDLITAAKMNLKLEDLSNNEENSAFGFLRFRTSGALPAGTVAYIGLDNTNDVTINALATGIVAIAIAGTDEFTFDATSFNIPNGNRIDFNATAGALAAFLVDVNNNELIETFGTASAVNHLAITNSATGNNVILGSGGTGSDANAGITLLAGGTGAIVIDNGTDPVRLQFNGAAGTDTNDIVDVNGNEIISMRGVASAVNELVIRNAATGAAPSIGVSGEANVGLTLFTAGTGIIILQSATTNRVAVNNAYSMTLYQATANYTMAWDDPAAARTITIPDPGGADSFAFLAATQTFTNKTLTTPTINSATLSGTLSGAHTLSGAVTLTSTLTFNGTNVDITVNPEGSTLITIDPDVFAAGTFINLQYDTAEVLTGAVTGVFLDLGTSVTTGGAGTGNIFGLHVDLGPLTVNAAYNGTIAGLRLEVDPTVGGSETLYGAQITTPGTYGAGTEVGISVTGDGETINIVNDADLYISMAKTGAVAISLQAIAPVVDINVDGVTTGTLITIDWTAAETLSGALVGINLNLDTNVTPSGQNVNGIILTMPATYGAGTEVGLQVTGDGQTINISNDADLYVSFAKASSVDINIQGISPVVDIGADVLENGVIIDFQYDTAETLSGASLTGVSINLNTNLTYLNDTDVIGFTTQTAAFTASGAVTTNITGYQLPTAGAIDNSNAGGTLAWRGLDIQMPNITQTAGTVTATGIRIITGTVTSGTAVGLSVDAALAIDLVTLGNRIDLDADNDTSIRASADDVIVIETLGNDSLRLDGVNFIVDLANDGTNAWRVDFDVDNDTSVRASSDDVLTWEIAGTDRFTFQLDAGSATGEIRSASATEIGFNVTNVALTVGTEGSIVLPDNAGVGSDGVFGDVNGCIGFDSTNNTIEIRDAGVWLSSAALTGYGMGSRVPWVQDGSGWYHPNQIWEGEFDDLHTQMVDETICAICGEPMEPEDREKSRALAFYPNAYLQKEFRGRRMLHSIFGHAHPEREPVIQRLQQAVDLLARRLGYADVEEALQDALVAA